MLNIHKNIIAVRRKRKLSQAQAADLVNISLRTYQRIESGETALNFDYLSRLANGFQCSIDDILNFNLETSEFPVEKTNQMLQENLKLEEENGYLRKLIAHLTKILQDSRGGGQIVASIIALQRLIYAQDKKGNYISLGV